MGHIGKRHAEMITRNPDAGLVAVCDIRTKEECALQGITAPFYASLDEMLQKQAGIDVINICTPNGLHAEMAIKAMEYGAHVVIEKPMATTKLDAEKIIQASLKTDRKVFCVMQNRYSPPSVWLKEILDKRSLGPSIWCRLIVIGTETKDIYANGSWHGTAALDGGTLFTQFSHFIDMVFWLFGDITNIKGTFNDFNHQGLTAFEDTGMVHFEFVDGGMGNLIIQQCLQQKTGKQPHCHC